MDDKKDARWASGHGLSDQGYPNVPIWDADGELVARVVGFGGMESWLPQVKGAADTSAKLKAAKEKAGQDPAGHAEVAKILAAIPDRQAEALAAFDKVPADRKDAATVAAEGGLRGKLAWEETNKKLNAGFSELVKDLDRKDRAKFQEGVKAAYAAYAPTALPMIEEWISKHGDKAPETAPGAHMAKVVFLARSGQLEAADAAAKALKGSYGSSREAQNVDKFLEAVRNEGQAPAPPAPPAK